MAFWRGFYNSVHRVLVDGRCLACALADVVSIRFLIILVTLLCCVGYTSAAVAISLSVADAAVAGSGAGGIGGCGSIVHLLCCPRHCCGCGVVVLVAIIVSTIILAVILLLGYW